MRSASAKNREEGQSRLFILASPLDLTHFKVSLDHRISQNLPISPPPRRVYPLSAASKHYLPSRSLLHLPELVVVPLPLPLLPRLPLLKTTLSSQLSQSVAVGRGQVASGVLAVCVKTRESLDREYGDVRVDGDTGVAEVVAVRGVGEGDLNKGREEEREKEGRSVVNEEKGRGRARGCVRVGKAGR